MPCESALQETDVELYEAMSTLRAVRRLRPDPIPEDVLQRVFSAATWAPTGGNVQPWRILAVTDVQARRRLGELYQVRWRAYAGNYRASLEGRSVEERAKLVRALAAGDYLADHMHEAPLIAVFCYNPDLMAITDADQDRPSVVGGGSVYPAVQNLLLAARNEGLGCVLTTLLCMEEPAVKALLDIPYDWYTCAHVPLGYPVGGGHGPISRKPVVELVYRDGWGEGW
jgi:nitroreductase